MTRAMQPEHDDLDDFERRLFESARADSPPPGATERAWLKFAAAAGSLAPLAPAPTPVPWFQGARAHALKWTLIGALGGGSLVAVWLRPMPVPLVPREPTGVAAATSAALASTPAANAELVSAPAASVTAASATAASVAEQPAAARSLPVAARHRVAGPAAAPNTGAAARAGSRAASLLAREVAALDAARTALAVGANASALRQIEQYHREFADGELSAEADVVAIEALAAAGDRTASRRAAEAFLARHPHDPHVARVRELGR